MSTAILVAAVISFFACAVATALALCRARQEASDRRVFSLPELTTSITKSTTTTAIATTAASIAVAATASATVADTGRKGPAGRCPWRGTHSVRARASNASPRCSDFVRAAVAISATDSAHRVSSRWMVLARALAGRRHGTLRPTRAYHSCATARRLRGTSRHPDGTNARCGCSRPSCSWRVAPPSLQSALTWRIRTARRLRISPALQVLWGGRMRRLRRHACWLPMHR